GGEVHHGRGAVAGDPGDRDRLGDLVVQRAALGLAPDVRVEHAVHDRLRGDLRARVLDAGLPFDLPHEGGRVPGVLDQRLRTLQIVRVRDAAGDAALVVDGRRDVLQAAAAQLAGGVVGGALRLRGPAALRLDL